MVTRQLNNRRRGENDQSGWVLLDKKSGMTSVSALNQIKKLFHTRKAGHSGILDPLAEGMLPLCLGEATKFSSGMLNAHKSYTSTFKLGEKTDTADRDGEVVATMPFESISEKSIEIALKMFKGSIQQIPPMYSALKHNGQRLYKLARRGEVVPREPRTVNIFAFELLGFDAPYLKVRVHCSKGCYVRVLAEDLGESLGTCAHVYDLHRNWVEPFENQTMVTYDALSEMPEETRKTHLLPIDTHLQHIRSITVSPAQTEDIMQGRKIIFRPNTGEEETPGEVRLLHPQYGFIGMGEVTPESFVQPKRLRARLD